MNVVFSAEAERDLDEIWIYLAETSGSYEVTARWVSHLTDSALRLGPNPRIGKIRRDIGEAIRSVTVKNYVIFYRPNEFNIQVLRILHGKRNVEALFKS
jgi:toxin ParE1/3/4